MIERIGKNQQIRSPKLIPNFHMTKNWKVTEKVIGGSEIVWGFLVLSLTIYGTTFYWDMFTREPDLINPGKMFLFIFKRHHNLIFLSGLSIYAGTTLLLNKKAGWNASVVATLVTALVFILNLWNVNYDKSRKMEFALFFMLIPIKFLIVFILLLNKQFRDKYTPSLKSWWIMGFAVIILLVDYLIFRK